jgi:hypothetical protein
MKDWLCVSAADSAHAPLLLDLMASFRVHPRDIAPEWAILDAGLNEAAKGAIAAAGGRTLSPDWHVDAAWFAPTPPAYMRALHAIPFLPRVFPGYRIYMYIDADVWVQDGTAIDLYLSAAAERGFAETPELDRSYTPVVAFQTRLLARRFGWRLARRLGDHPAINSGVFCALGDSPLWDMWQAMISKSYSDLRAGHVNPHSRGSRRWLWHAIRSRFAPMPVEADFWLNQLSLTRLIQIDRAPAALLPAWCNWTCHAALPVVGHDGRTLCEPEPPYRPLGLVHLTGDTKRRDAVELRALSGGIWKGSLRYRALTPAAAS